MKDQIAIIGMSVKVSNAETLLEFKNLIEKNRPQFNDLSEIRKKDISDRYGALDFAKAAYLERIDLFDNKYFEILDFEALRMDPEQRLLLENVVRTIHNAGYSETELKGRKIGVFHTLYHSLYENLFDEKSHTSLTNNPGMLGTRIANFMNWTGPVLGVDTTCSSSLAALYLACNSLTLGDCEMAYVGGVHLGVLTTDQRNASPILSNKDTCLPFDKDADGTMHGEGMCGIIIKKLEHAIRDNDPIHAIIKGGAINHGGSSIKNITAPSVTAQAQVIIESWKNSDTNANDVHFIETHGTGTVLGDPIEFEGISSAFKKYLDTTQHTCSISSAKGQFGHLDAVAGLLGLIRLVIALENKKMLPQTGFSTINNYIDEKKPCVKIQRKLEDWKSEKKRIGGVSSFGLSGTNVHFVIEEYADIEKSREEVGLTDRVSHLIKISGSSLSNVNEIRSYLRLYLIANKNIDLHRLCQSVNTSLNREEYGNMFVFKDQDELLEKLNEPVTETREISNKKEQVFLFLGEVLESNDLKMFEAKCKNILEIKKDFENKLGIVPNQNNAKKQLFLLQSGLIKILREQDLSINSIIGSSYSKLTMQLLNQDFAGDFDKLFDAVKYNGSVDDVKLTSFLNSLDPQKEYLFFNVKNDGILEIINKWSIKNENKITTVNCTDKYDIGYQLIAGFYNSGYNVNLSSILKKEKNSIDLDLPIFEYKRFWPKVNLLTKAATAELHKTLPDTKASGIKLENIISYVHKTWCGLLQIDELKNEDDFFEMGGTSLLGLDLLDKIESEYKVILDYQDVFDYSTVLSQSELIKKRMEGVSKEEHSNIEAVAISPVIDTHEREKNYKQLIYRIQNELKDVKKIRPDHILLTGGTGYLGTFLLKELLGSTNACIYCIVRGETDDLAKKRLKETVLFYFPDFKFESRRIKVLKGDTDFSNLNLSEAGIAELKNIDIVYHLAASVSHYAKKEVTNKINFEGTINVFEWSKKNKIKYFNFFSTNAVAAGSIKGVKETEFYETDLFIGQDYRRNFYPKSKFDSEEYLSKNASGIDINIFRIGNIGCNSITGKFQKNIESNNFYQQVKLLSQLDYYCDEILEIGFETTPIDMVLKSVLALSLRKNEMINIFHISANNDLIRAKDFIRAFESIGIYKEKIDQVDFDKYIEQKFSGRNASESNLILGLMKFQHDHIESTRFNFRTDATAEYLKILGVDVSFDKQFFVSKMIENCVELKFIYSNQ